MSDKTFVIIVVSVVVLHFVAAVGFLIWKISSAPKSSEETDDDTIV